MWIIIIKLRMTIRHIKSMIRQERQGRVVLPGLERVSHVALVHYQAVSQSMA